MPETIEPAWLQRAKRLAAIAQNGLTFSTDAFDRERYESIREIAAGMLADSGNAPLGQVHELFALDTGYATPKVDVRGVVFHDDKLLFVRERSDGLWTLPGGWADVGDSIREAVEREIREESGFVTRATKLLAVLHRPKHPHPALAVDVYKVFVRCDLEGGEARTSVETDDVAFFAQHELPQLSLARVVPSQIARLFDHLKDPDLPTDFD